MLEMKAGFVPIRKPGKLPYATIASEYQREYGKNKLEVYTDAFGPGRRVLLIDDVLATGGNDARLPRPGAVNGSRGRCLRVCARTVVPRWPRPP